MIITHLGTQQSAPNVSTGISISSQQNAYAVLIVVAMVIAKAVTATVIVTVN